MHNGITIDCHGGLLGNPTRERGASSLVTRSVSKEPPAIHRSRARIREMQNIALEQKATIVNPTIPTVSSNFPMTGSKMKKVFCLFLLSMLSPAALMAQDKPDPWIQKKLQQFKPLTDEQKAAIEQAVPNQSTAKPKKTRKVLVFYRWIRSQFDSVRQFGNRGDGAQDGRF